MRKLFLCALLSVCFYSVFAQSYDPKLFSKLNFRFIGPDGNRMIAVAGEPGNPNVSYSGAASGGLWKTDDAGITWKSVFDDTEDSAIGAIGIAPSSPKQVWVGTGETFLIRPAHAVGNGVYKSSNAGKTWKNMGLEKTYRISRVIVHPADTNTVYVASMGHTHGPQQERGVYKTIDGGKTWERVFFVNENTGCSDLSIDPKNPEILYAAMWQADIRTWNLSSGGEGSGIYRSKDGGKTWEPLRNGLESGPGHPVGKTSVDVSYTNPKRVYALVEDTEPRLYRSDDGGDSWMLMQKNHSMGQRAGYYTRLRVSTSNEDEVYTICVGIMKSIDGGKSFVKDFNQWGPGGDNHDMWFDPKDGNRILCAHDGCLNMTYNGGKTWRNINLPIAQMYHVAVDDRVPYWVYGNRQDAWSYRGPSRYLGGWSIPLGAWHGVGGCESGFAQPDPFDNNIVWSGCYDGGLDVFDLTTMHARDVRVWPQTQIGETPANAKYRWHWNFPMVLSKHVKGKVWVGSQFVHETNNGGQGWQVISPDLTTNDKTHQRNSGGMASDNLMTWDGCTLYSMAESPVKAGVLWTGSNDGQVNVTQDGGKTWTNVSANIPGLPQWGTIRHIDASYFDAGTCYIAVDAHYVGDFGSYVYKTSDYGTTWRRLEINLPANNSNFVNQIKEDPDKQGLLWLGTEKSLYFSPDDGKSWVHLKNNLPPVPIFGIEIQRNFKDLVIATYGRGIYILDDITPIREFSEQVQNSEAHLFSLRKAYRFQDINGIKTDNSYVSGRNPPDGADINYYLKEKSKDSVEVVVLNSRSEVVRKIAATNKPGVNRVWWDLRLQPYEMPKLRTKPRGKDWVKLDEKGERNMFIYDLDIGPGQTPPMTPPGTYTIVLKVNGKEYKQSLMMVKDPNTKGTEADIVKQYGFGVKLYSATTTTLKLIDEMERMRARLLEKKSDKKSIALEERIYQLEAALHDVHATGARMDIFRNPPQVLERLFAMAKEGQISSADAPPTDQQQEVFKLVSDKLAEVQSQFELIKKTPEIKRIEGI
ncbi:MAG TPA: glycosyl hydrolase [Cyclobacteriaceae bacterium]|nr:glycosyl hydrolase [Cyclobacteriaceae bacterium]